jgi:hypothetical protein
VIPSALGTGRVDPTDGRNGNGGTMADKEWTVKDLMEALKRFSPEAKVYYEMGPNGPGTIGKVQYVKVWGEDDEPGVLLDR